MFFCKPSTSASFNPEFNCPSSRNHLSLASLIHLQKSVSRHLISEVLIPDLIHPRRSQREARHHELCYLQLCLLSFPQCDQLENSPLVQFNSVAEYHPGSQLLKGGICISESFKRESGQKISLTHFWWQVRASREMCVHLLDLWPISRQCNQCGLVCVMSKTTESMVLQIDDQPCMQRYWYATTHQDTHERKTAFAFDGWKSIARLNRSELFLFVPSVLEIILYQLFTSNLINCWKSCLPVIQQHCSVEAF